MILNLNNFDDFLVSVVDKYGDTACAFLPGKPDYVFTTNPKNVEHILKTNFANYEKGPFFRNSFHDLLGNGIFNADGVDWKSQRKITSNLFNVKNFREGMVTTFIDHAELVLKLIDQTPHDIDASDLFYRYTLDSVGCIGEPCSLSPSCRSS